MLGRGRISYIIVPFRDKIKQKALKCKQCLHFDYGVDLKSKLRKDISDEELKSIIYDNIYDKPEKHLFLEKSDHKELKFMNQIGG